jgi:hypothetical protein
MDQSNPSWEERLTQLDRDYPLRGYTGASCLITSIRRMRAEREQRIPIHLRTGFPVSVAFGKAANELNEDEWEAFYESLCAELKRKYPQACRSDVP